MRIKKKYSKAFFELIIKQSNSFGQCLEKLKIKSRGVNYRTVHKYISLYNIDTSHFNSEEIRISKLIARAVARGRSLNELLVNGSNIQTGALKKKLYAAKLKKRKCEICGQGELWKGVKISLILDHIDGNNKNNLLKNLRIVCPNCNAGLPTHSGKNIKKSTFKELVINVCSCGNKMFRTSKQCIICLRKKDKFSKIDLPVFKNELWEIPTTHLCEKYNISYTYINKYCKKNKIQKPSRGYWSSKKHSEKINMVVLV
jgi:hypothetical protein